MFQLSGVLGNKNRYVHLSVFLPQVISPTGKLMGSKEIRVGKDKVEIERLMVRVISGMNLHISEDHNLPGALVATVYLRDHLVTQQMVGGGMDCTWSRNVLV